MSGVSRFDCFPSDFLNGTIGMTADQIAVYTIVLMLQYDRGETVVYEGRERELAMRAGLSRNRLAAAISSLVDLGKIELENGRLNNRRTAQELEKIRERISKNRENSAKGGESTREKFYSKHNKNNESIEPGGQPIGQPPLGSIPRPPSPVHKDDDKSSSIGREFDDDFWPTWGKLTGNRVSKKPARTAFIACRRKHSLETILAGIENYARTKPPTRDWLHPSTFLNQERFDDAPAPAPQARAGPSAGGGGVAHMVIETYREIKADERERSEARNRETPCVLSFDPRMDSGANAGDDGGFSRPDVGLLVGSAVRRM